MFKRLNKRVDKSQANCNYNINLNVQYSRQSYTKNKNNNCKIYIKSLLFIALKSDIEVDENMLNVSGMRFYSWGMMSTIRRNKFIIYMCCTILCRMSIEDLFWSWITAVLEFCKNELFWVVSSVKGVSGCCLDEIQIIWKIFNISFNNIWY